MVAVNSLSHCDCVLMSVSCDDFDDLMFLSFELLLRLQSSLEHDVYSRLSSLQEGLIPKKRAGADDDLHRINELIQVTTR